MALPMCVYWLPGTRTVLGQKVTPDFGGLGGLGGLGGFDPLMNDVAAHAGALRTVSDVLAFSEI